MRLRVMDRMKPHIGLTINVIAIVTFIFFGGSLWHTVVAHESRLTRMEEHGSSSLQKHEALDQERIDAIRTRVSAVEQAVIIIGDMRVDLRTIQDKLDQLQRQMTSTERKANEAARNMKNGSGYMFPEPK